MRYAGAVRRLRVVQNVAYVGIGEDALWCKLLVEELRARARKGAAFLAIQCHQPGDLGVRLLRLLRRRVCQRLPQGPALGRPRVGARS